VEAVAAKLARDGLDAVIEGSCFHGAPIARLREHDQDVTVWPVLLTVGLLPQLLDHISAKERTGRRICRSRRSRACMGDAPASWNGVRTAGSRNAGRRSQKPPAPCSSRPPAPGSRRKSLRRPAPPACKEAGEPAPHRRPPRHRRRQMGPGRRRSRPHPPRGHRHGDFDEYWRFHLEREHQHLYPGVKQGQYALGA